MKIFVKVKTRAKTAKVIDLGDNNFLVEVTAPPVEGRANESVVEALAIFFDIAKSRMRIVSGKKSKQKVIELH